MPSETTPTPNLMPDAFRIVAGADARRAENTSRDQHVRPSSNRPGSHDSGSLVHWQTHAGRDFRSVELVSSLYGWSVHASSGLAGFALLAFARNGQLDGSFGAARSWAERWVAEDPSHRYAFVRVYDLTRAGLDVDSFAQETPHRATGWGWGHRSHPSDWPEGRREEMEAEARMYYGAEPPVERVPLLIPLTDEEFAALRCAIERYEAVALNTVGSRARHVAVRSAWLKVVAFHEKGRTS